MRTFHWALCLILISGASWAGQEFPCSKATASIVVAEATSVDGELRMRTTFTVESPEGESVSISYVGRIDFDGGVCVTDVKGNARVLFQAYCGGSGCKDLDNWGIVDPDALQILLAPYDSNAAEARRVLGVPPTPPKVKLSVRAEAEKLGVEVP